MFKDQIIIALKKSAGVEEVNLEFSENPEFGDYSSNIALIRAKKENKSPQQLAEEIVEKINAQTTIISFMKSP